MAPWTLLNALFWAFLGFTAGLALGTGQASWIVPPGLMLGAFLYTAALRWRSQTTTTPTRKDAA